jgi:hypothetical protein
MPVLTGREDKSAYASSVANQPLPQGKLVSIKNANIEFVPGVGYVKPKEPSPEGTVTVTRIIEPKPKEPKYLVRQLDPFFGPSMIVPYASAPEGWKKNAVVVDTYYPEERAILGLGLATTVGVGVTVPVLGVASIVGVSGGEAVKVGVTGQHLTASEAIMIAGASQLIAGEGIRAAPFVRQNFNRLMNWASPERALYNRVVNPLEPSESPVSLEPSQGFFEKVTSKVSPERAMYKRVIGGASEPNVPSDFMPGESRSEWVSQLLVRQAPVQKAAMKPFSLSMQVPKEAYIPVTISTVMASPKTAMKQITVTQVVQQREMIRTVTQQVSNPFLAFSGSPYYRQRQREDTETIYLSYPNQRGASALEQSLMPQSVTKQTYKAIQVEDLMGTTKQAFSQSQMSFQIQGTRQSQVQVQTQKQVQEQVLGQTQMQKNLLRNDLFSMGDFDIGGFRKRGSDPFGLFGRYRREYPIKTSKEMWKWLK